MKDSKKLEQQLKRIEELSNDLSVSKYNLLKINFLVRLIEDSARFQHDCPECKLNSRVLESMIEEIPYLDDIEHRQPYEQQFNKIRKHFHEAHGYIPLYHFISRWSIAGVAIGAGIAFVITLIFHYNYLYDGLLIGLAFGLISGYLAGSVKESKYRKAKKII